MNRHVSKPYTVGRHYFLNKQLNMRLTYSNIARGSLAILVAALMMTFLEKTKISKNTDVKTLI